MNEIFESRHRASKLHQRIVRKNVDTYFGPQKVNIGRESKFGKIALEIQNIISPAGAAQMPRSTSQLTDGSPKIKCVPIVDLRQLSDRPAHPRNPATKANVWTRL
jgi:hypothetical protein